MAAAALLGDGARRLLLCSGTERGRCRFPRGRSMGAAASLGGGSAATAVSLGEDEPSLLAALSLPGPSLRGYKDSKSQLALLTSIISFLLLFSP